MPDGPSLVAPALAFLHHLGACALLGWRCAAAMFRRPFETRELLKQIESLGIRSLGLVTVTSVFIGMVMATQFAFGLRKFGGLEYTGRLIGVSFARELAPSLMAVIVGGRIGAGIAAELGSMVVTEQIDAIVALGADPVKKLVMPRVLASVVVLPILSTLSLVLGFGGATLIADSQFDMPAAFFFNSALDQLDVFDYLMGLIKTPVFGLLIALVGCYLGLQTRGGTRGVGTSTTRSVVSISIAILSADFLMSHLLIEMYDLLALG